MKVISLLCASCATFIKSSSFISISIVVQGSSSFPISPENEIIISTDKGKVIRTSVKEIRIAGRNTQGVRIIKLSNNEKVVSAIKIDDNFI